MMAATRTRASSSRKEVSCDVARGLVTLAKAAMRIAVRRRRSAATTWTSFAGVSIARLC
jgi:hypothetical protein